MSLFAIENALNLAKSDFGLDADFTISEEDKLFLTDSNSEINLGSYFGKNLQKLIEKPLYELRREDKIYCDSVRAAKAEITGINLSSQYWLSTHRSQELDAFGDFDLAFLEDQLKSPKYAALAIAVQKMNEIFDQAYDSKALRAVLYHATLPKFLYAKKGLEETLAAKYDVIMDELERNNFVIKTELPPGIPDYFQPRLDQSLPLVEKWTTRVGEIRDDVESLAAVIIKIQLQMRSDVVDFASKTLEIFSNRLYTESLNEDERKIVAEFLVRSKGMIKSFRDKKYIRTVERKL